MLDEPVEATRLSLEERLHAARGSREQATTEDFPIPGISAYAWVRFRALGFKAQAKQVEKNKRVRDQATMNLYVAADTLVAATDGFYEVDQTDEENLIPSPGSSWNSLCKATYDVGDELTPRQALIRLVGDGRLIQFYNEYNTWLIGEREATADEQRQDFGGTPSR